MIFRHYDHPDRTALAKRTVTAARRRGIPVLIAGDVRLAISTHADGVHIPESSMNRLAALRLWRRQTGAWLTAAAHSAQALHRAQALKADAVLLSPVFATASHPGARPLGRFRFAALARRAGRPVFALGGITPERARTLRALGAAGYAGIGFILSPTKR